MLRFRLSGPTNSVHAADAADVAAAPGKTGCTQRPRCPRPARVSVCTGDTAGPGLGGRRLWRIIHPLVQTKKQVVLDRKRMALKQISSNKCFGGLQKVFEHDSVELNCKMKFAVYLPPKAETGKCPALYWLSGLTCTEQNFISKSGYHQAASEHGLVVIAPDTSPRGCNIKGEDESWDFGTGAGFYVDATEDPWKTNYRMYSYVTKELPQLINASFPVDPQRMSIFGHSMGGHGALICALKNPGKYKSVSAFAPICNPVLCPWGKKAFSGYLGTDLNKWKVSGSSPLDSANLGGDSSFHSVTLLLSGQQHSL